MLEMQVASRSLRLLYSSLTHHSYSHSHSYWYSFPTWAWIATAQSAAASETVGLLPGSTGMPNHRQPQRGLIAV